MRIGSLWRKRCLLSVPYKPGAAVGLSLVCFEGVSAQEQTSLFPNFPVVKHGHPSWRIGEMSADSEVLSRPVPSPPPGGGDSVSFPTASRSLPPWSHDLPAALLWSAWFPK